MPKISSSSRCSRTVLTAEQLVEAPTLVSLVDVIEQTVGIPAGASGGSGYGGFQGSLPRQFFSYCRADRRHSCAWPFVWFWRSSRFTLFSRSSWRRISRRRFSHFSPAEKKVRGSLRTWGRNWVRSPAHPRRRLITTASGLMRPAAYG